MQLIDIELPSNKKFGLFFCLVFLALSVSTFLNNKSAVASLFFLLCIIFLILSLVKADVLLPLNKLWMRFGFLLGMIVSPVVLGVLFFGLFTPISLFMRLFGRDELHLRSFKSESYWIPKEAEKQTPDGFKHQF
jgi:hypothetical protein